MNFLTTHVLDTALGRPGAGITVAIDFWDPTEASWSERAKAVTDTHGRIAHFELDVPPLAGVYRFRFLVGAYFQGLDLRSFYPEIMVIVRIDDPAEHYHVPLLLNPFGYTTYRGT